MTLTAQEIEILRLAFFGGGHMIAGGPCVAVARELAAKGLATLQERPKLAIVWVAITPAGRVALAGSS